MRDLHELPKLRDSLSYLYVEHAIVEQKDAAIEYVNEDGKVHVPIASLCVLMLGPGTSITHAAIKTLADNGCLVMWTGEDCVRFYAAGCGETRKAYHLLKQAELVCNPVKRKEVVLRMYKKRFNDQLDNQLTLPQIRGLEGVRVREAYAAASKKYGVLWTGRHYDRNRWDYSDPINQALSSANSALYAICHAALVSGGYSPALGFIHTGRQLSFVYDIADLYKVPLTIPIAFQIASESMTRVDKQIRSACREKFREEKLLERILPDVDELLGIKSGDEDELKIIDGMEGMPVELWEELFEGGK